MSAPAFTPGPWRIAKRGEDEAFYVVERDEPNEPSRHAYRVAHVLDYNELQQNAANACLIAAAPDLYEALDRINVAACYASEEDTDAREAVLLHIGELARAALAKALAVQP